MQYDLTSDFQRKAFLARCDNLLEKGAVVELTEKTFRSPNQNRYLHLLRLLLPHLLLLRHLLRLPHLHRLLSRFLRQRRPFLRVHLHRFLLIRLLFSPLPLLHLLLSRKKVSREQAKDLWKDGKPKRWYYAIPIVVIWLLILWVIVKAIWF